MDFHSYEWNFIREHWTSGVVLYNDRLRSGP